MTNIELDALRRHCDIANKFWGRLWSALHAVVLREKGEAALHRLWLQVLGSHQKSKYRDGLRKLGIKDDEPPAVAAAKYHYFTNIIGGLTMEYVEESPKKVWIRYTAPMWTYPDVSMLAIPPAIRRTAFSGWHPFNGKLMGCPRLGWVATKFITEGHPYDEGYFIEYDHDLAPGEELRFEIVTHTPECNPSHLPRLDAALWPEPRRLKAHRNWSGGYVRTTIEQLQVMFGESVTNWLVSEAVRGLAIQFAHQFKRDLDIERSDVASLAKLLSAILESCGQEIAQERMSSSKHRIIIRTFKPFENDAAEELRAAFFHFPQLCIRALNGHVSITRQREAEAGAAGAEIWDLEDRGRWLW